MVTTNNINYKIDLYNEEQNILDDKLTSLISDEEGNCFLDKIKTKYKIYSRQSSTQQTLNELAFGTSTDANVTN